MTIVRHHNSTVRFMDYLFDTTELTVLPKMSDVTLEICYNISVIFLSILCVLFKVLFLKE